MVRFHRLLKRAEHERQLDAEIRFHLERQLAEYVAQGKTSEEAHRQVQMAFGGVTQTKEACRDIWGGAMLSVFRDIRFAARGLWKDRRIAFLAILALALGIGASTLGFSVIYNLILSPYPYRDSDRLTTLTIRAPKSSGRAGRSQFSIQEFLTYQRNNRVFEDMVGSYDLEVHYLSQGSAEVFLGAYVTANTFDFFGVQPLLGRGITREDDKPGAAPVFVMNYKLWKDRFYGDPRLLGTTWDLNGKQRTLVGIMPPRFQAYGVGLWFPLGLNSGDDGTVGRTNEPTRLWVIARRKPQVTLRAAAADLSPIALSLAKTYPKLYPANPLVVVKDLNDYVMGDFRIMLFAVLFAVLTLQLIACTNVASLLLARATARGREIAIRVSIGASRSRLASQFLSESLIIAFGGCAVGCLLAHYGIKWIVAMIPQGPLPDEAVIELNAPVLLFTIFLSIITTFICGMAPMLQVYRGDWHSRLLGNGKGTGGSIRDVRLRAALVVSEVALSTVLLIGAGLMIRTLAALTSLNLGFDPSKLLYVQLVTPRDHYESFAQTNSFFHEVLRQTAALPGVTAAAESSSIPPTRAMYTDVQLFGKPHYEVLDALIELCSDGYFPALELHTLRGRLMSNIDVEARRKVAVINQTFANNFLPGQDPVGQRVKFLALGQNGARGQAVDVGPDDYFEIIGVVSDFRNHGIRDPAMPEAFVPFTLSIRDHQTILVRTTAAPERLLNAVRQIIGRIDSTIALRNAGSIQQFLDEYSFRGPRFGVAVLSTFSMIGLALAMIGIFGVTSYAVSTRTQEVGVRVALGATESDILWWVVSTSLKVVLVGLVFGLGMSIGLTELLQSQVWGITARDPWTFGSVTALIISVGVVACLVPAYQAAKLAPWVALRVP